MFSLPGNMLEGLSPVFAPNPVNRYSPWAQGLTSFVAGLPGQTGGPRLCDLMRQQLPLSVNGQTANIKWAKVRAPSGLVGLDFSACTNADTQYVAYPTITLGTSWTIGCWLYFVPNAQYPIVLFVGGKNGFVQEQNLLINAVKNDALFAGSFAPTANTWVHLMCSWNGATAVFAANGKAGAASQADSGYIATNQIGGRLPGFAGPQKGIVSDCIVWGSRALSQADMARFYNTQAARGYPSLLNRMQRRLMGQATVVITTAPDATFQPRTRGQTFQPHPRGQTFQPRARGSVFYPVLPR
ncbi:MAG TPA: LamG-like jellyroll fold domain-containing protein [Planctomycetaceae bacterium]|jgi:hypothetical protein